MTIRTKRARRADALERVKSYTWKNSKIKRTSAKGTSKEQKERWESNKADHIEHLSKLG